MKEVHLVFWLLIPIFAKEMIKPSALKSGDTVGLISPSSPYIYEVPDANTYLKKLEEIMLGVFDLNVKYGQHMNETFGYLAGNDSDRAFDVNAMFADNTVQFILANRGGFGCGRILDLLDYDMIKLNPKVIMGYSDLTALLLAIYFKTGLIVFYGPMGIDNWLNLNMVYVQKILFDSQLVLYKNPTNYSVTTLYPGRSKGRLIGGNLSVFVSLLGSPYFPASNSSWENVILFLEDVGEQPYRIDRMMTSLSLSGIFRKICGFVWGICVKCDAPDPSRSLSIQQILLQHLGTIPSMSGFMFGHIDQQFTFPIGVLAQMDSIEGTIQLLESGVQK